jgi:flagellar biosynthesis/type III secretory pathway protein FliH
MTDDLKLPSKKQAEIVKAAKHILALAHAGRLIAIGYAVLNLDDDGDISGGTNAVWTDNTQVREGLKTQLATLNKRIGAKSSIILQ